MRDFATPQECVDATGFWKVEEALQQKAVDVIKKFEKIKPHDMFKIEPQGYN